MKTRESFWGGSGLILVAAISFGMQSSLVKRLFLLGSNPVQVLFYEMVLAVLILGGACIFFGTESARMSIREAGRVLFWGGIGVGGTALALYGAMERIPVAVAIVLLFYYVPWVFLLEFLRLRIRPSGKRWAALTMILTGTLLATDFVGVSWRDLDLWGIVLGLTSGICYGTFIFTSRGLGSVATPLRRSFVICTGVGLLLALGGAIRPAAVFVPPDDLGLFVVLIVTVTFMGQIIPLLAFSRAIPIIGGALAAIIASVELPVASLVAFFLLGESLGFAQWVGVFLIAVAVIVGNWNRRELAKVSGIP